MRFFSTLCGRARGIAAIGALVPTLVLAACSGQGNSMTAPSAADGSTLAKPPAPADPGTTTVSFSGYVEATLSVNVNTSTTATVGQPYIDEGKIQIQVWVDASGTPATWSGGATGTWVRIDQWSGGGKNPSSGLTSTPVDLDSLSSLSTTDVITSDVGCGDTVSFRAHYVTGGGQPQVATHTSEPPTNFTITCGVCITTYSQGYWKNHTGAWPVSSLMLGTRLYSQAELVSILADTSNNGNGLVILSIQLIAAKLNRAYGAPDTGGVDAQIAAADALIGSLVVPPVGSDWVAPNTVETIKDALEAYNLSCPESD